MNPSASSSTRRKGDAPAQPLHSPNGAGHESGTTLDCCWLNRSYTSPWQHILTPKDATVRVQNERQLLVRTRPSASWGFSLRPLDIQSPAGPADQPASAVNESGRTNVTRCLPHKIPTPPAMPSLPSGIIGFTSNLSGPVTAQRAGPLDLLSRSHGVKYQCDGDADQPTNRSGTKDLRPAALHPVSKSA